MKMALPLWKAIRDGLSNKTISAGIIKGKIEVVADQAEWQRRWWPPAQMGEAVRRGLIQQ